MIAQGPHTFEEIVKIGAERLPLVWRRFAFELVLVADSRAS